ncbi:hypothetical protein U4Y41_15670, partial [Escherichia coli]|nr:hypothetical protein [Escherichia coli]
MMPPFLTEFGYLCDRCDYLIELHAQSRILVLLQTLFATGQQALQDMLMISMTIWLKLKWSTKTGHRVRVFSSIDFPIRLVVT